MASYEYAKHYPVLNREQQERLVEELASAYSTPSAPVEGTPPNVQIHIENLGKDPKETMKLMEASACCCCHVKGVVVTLFVLWAISFVINYVVYSYDPSLDLMARLVNMHDTLYNSAGVVIFLIIEAAVLISLFFALVTNGRYLLIPAWLYLAILAIAELSIAIFYSILGCLGSLGQYHSGALDAFNVIRTAYMVGYSKDELTNPSEKGIVMTIVSCMLFAAVLNMIVGYIIERLWKYLKRRSEYYGIV